MEGIKIPLNISAKAFKHIRVSSSPTRKKCNIHYWCPWVKLWGHFGSVINIEWIIIQNVQNVQSLKLTESLSSGWYAQDSEGPERHARKYCWHQPSAKQTELTTAWEKTLRNRFHLTDCYHFLWGSVMTAMILTGKIIRMQNLWSCGYTFVFSVIVCAISKITNAIISRWFFFSWK